MSKKHKGGKLPKPSKAMRSRVAEQMKRLEAAGWLAFHGFRSTDGHVAVEPSDNLLRLMAVSGLPAEVVVAQLLRNMDEIDDLKKRFKTPGDEDVTYV